MARMGGRGVAGGYAVRTVGWAQRSRRMDVRNFLFFMASLPFLWRVLRASPTALTGARAAAKVLRVDPLSACGTETAKHSA